MTTGPAASPAASPVVGTWRLNDYFLEGEPGEGTRPLGAAPLGRLLYAPDGSMAVQYMAGDRAPLPAASWAAATDEERLDAVRTFGGYTGTYEWLGDRVAHHVETSVYPNWIGATLIRLAVLRGSLLTLRADRSASSRPTPVLVWERLERRAVPS